MQVKQTKENISATSGVIANHHIRFRPVLSSETYIG